MKTTLQLHLIFLALAGALCAQAADIESGTNTISGVVQFSNADPDILARLGPPGNEGMKDLVIDAYSAPPDSLRAVKILYGVDKLSAPYALTVAANDVPLVYDVYPVLTLDGGVEQYWPTTQASAPLTSNSPPATLDFNECVALLELRYVDTAGLPVAALGGRALAYEPATSLWRARYESQPPGRTGNFLVVPSGVEFTLDIEVDTGTDIYLDRLTHAETHTMTLACDDRPVLTITIPDAVTLGRIVGTVNMTGLIEPLLDGYAELITRPVIKARGPSGNQRYGSVDGELPGADLTRTFALENLVPSTAWSVQAEMQFGTGYRFQYFLTPSLGYGLNPGVAVTAGATTDLAEQFVMNPAKLTGTITLTGPPEFDGNISALRGLYRSADYDLDLDGLPDGIGSVGIGGSVVTVVGVDELAPGATLATVGASASASYEGAFNPATAAFEGDYEIALGSLDNQPGVWKQDSITVQIYHPGTNGGPYVDGAVYITEDQPWRGVLAPGETATRDLNYGFAEVCYRIKSPARFYNPRIANSYGYHTNYDGAGNVISSYSAYLGSAYGLPGGPADATNEALLTLYVPAGSYNFHPAISVVDADGSVSEVQLPAIDITVVAQERYCLEECIRLVIEPPICTPNFGFFARATATSLCGETLTNLSLRASPLSDPSIRLGYSDSRMGARTELTTAHGLFPEFDGFDRSLYQDILYTATAKDNLGRTATRQIIAHYDLTAPELRCPGDLSAASPDGAGVVVEFTATATDNRPEPLRGPICVPPSGSVFPVGMTTVTCTASDLCRNTNTCSFTVTVLPPATDCLLNIELTTLAPPTITLTWDCAATLQCAPSITGPWTSLPGATSPYPTPADGPQKFFRLCLSGDCSGTPPPPPAVYEPFDYPSGATLGNGNGGFGFTGAWDPAANLLIEATSLSFSPLATTGGSASGFGGVSGSRSLVAPIGADGTTVYLSFLVQPGNASEAGTVDGYYGLSLFGDTGSLFIGKPGGQGGVVGVSQEYVIENFGGTSQAFAGVAVTPHQTVLLVVKCEFAVGNDTFTLYVNPAPGAAEPATGAVKSDANIGTCGTLTISSGYNAAHTFILDEIRLGATFESVTPR